MKKLISVFTVLAVATWVLGPIMVAGISTSVTPDTNGTDNSKPIIKAKWEMKGPCFDDLGNYNYCTAAGGEGLDDSTALGAQFLPPEQGWGYDMNYTICAVVEGPEQNIDNIDRVIAEVFYPKDREMHVSNPAISCGTSGVKNEDGNEIDNPTGGCGAMIEQNFLHRLSQADGINLVCNELKNNNANLIEWSSDQYDYDDLCNSETGQLVKGWAAVYCADKSLTWEDPAGDYRVQVTAIDTDNDQDVFENYFRYLETMGYEVDFDAVNYGNVKIGEHKRVYGDKCFGEQVSGDGYTVRNTGNVKIKMKIAQDDMGLGYQTGTTQWNVEYDARVGDLESDWITYKPFAQKGPGVEPSSSGHWHLMGEVLNLSEIEEMDFSIRVIEKWPGNADSYTGTMWLSPVRVNWNDCL